MAKTPLSQCRVPRFDPWSGNWIPYVATKDPISFVPQLRSKEAKTKTKLQIYATAGMLLRKVILSRASTNNAKRIIPHVKFQNRQNCH